MIPATVGTVTARISSLVSTRRTRAEDAAREEVHGASVAESLARLDATTARLNAIAARLEKTV